MFGLVALLAAVVVGTWNGNWFPSGRAEHRAPPAVEAKTIREAAKMLSAGLSAVDPLETNDVILCLNEIRGPKVASNLVAQIGRPGLRVAVISGYRRRDRFDQQQDVIATTLPVAEAHWSRWRQAGRLTPPRGYAFAAVVIDAATTANVYAVHLKANYRAKGAELAENAEKRAKSVEQVIRQETPKKGRATRPVVLAGDLNADKWRNEFADERQFAALEAAGFGNVLDELPAGMRGTHPSARYGDSALDYVFFRGLQSVARPQIVPNDGLSDHNALFAVLDCPRGKSADFRPKGTIHENEAIR